MTFSESWIEKHFLIDLNNELVERQALEHFR